MFIRVRQIVRNDDEEVEKTHINFVALSDIRRIEVTTNFIDKANNIVSCFVEFKSPRISNKKGEILDDAIEIGANEEKIKTFLLKNNLLYEF
jgi:hypothetical protein